MLLLLPASLLLLKISTFAGIPSVHDVLTAAGLPALAGAFYFVGIPVVACIIAVVGVPAIAYVPALAGTIGFYRADDFLLTDYLIIYHQNSGCGKQSDSLISD
jgi:hypothetical protein